MTKAEAFAKVEEAVLYGRIVPGITEALDKLRPVPPKRKGARKRDPLKRLERPEMWGRIDFTQLDAYLDTFGALGSPERAAQAQRLRELPHVEQFAYEPPRKSLKADERLVYVNAFLNRTAA